MNTGSAHMLPSAEHIKQQQSKQYALPIEPWVAANVSRLWQGMKKHIQHTIASGSATASGTQAQPHTAQSRPASVRSHS